VTHADLVAVATVGTAQRPLPDLPEGLLPASGAGSEPAFVLLDAAAVYGVIRRATLPTREGAAPPPAPDDPRPEPSERFVSALVRLLPGPDTTPAAPYIPALLTEALGWIAAVGWRIPDRLLVPLLGQSVRDRTVARAMAAVLGERGRWLAAQNPAWAAALADESAIKLSEETWHEGTPAQRIGYLTAVRAADPEAGRALLEATWGSEGVAERVAFAEVIAATALPSDEAFLEAALRDRSARVADAARPGLLLISGSALAQRLRRRAAEAVTVRRGLLARTVHLTAPDDGPDAAADGLVAGTYSRTPAENRLNCLVASIPPAEWPALVGVHAAELLGAKAEQSWSVVGGLAAAAVRFRDATLASDLVDAGIRTPGILALLKPARLARLLDDPGTDLEPATMLGVVASWSQPWTRDQARIVDGWLRRRATSSRTGQAAIPDAFWTLPAVAVPPELARGWAERLRALSHEPHVPLAAQRRARASAATLTLRAGMYDDVRAALDHRTTLEDR
jgi:hypothetical protein